MKLFISLLLFTSSRQTLWAFIMAKQATQYVLAFQSHRPVSTHHRPLFRHGKDYYFPSEISRYDHEDDKTDSGEEKEIIPKPIRNGRRIFFITMPVADGTSFDSRQFIFWSLMMECDMIGSSCIGLALTQVRSLEDNSDWKIFWGYFSFLMTQS